MLPDYSTPMVDLADIGVSLAADDGDPRFLLEISEGNLADIEFRELLEFHRGYFEGEESKGYPLARTWSQATDESGYLTAYSQDRLVVGYRELLSENRVSGVTVTYASGLEFDDEPSVAVTFTSPFDEGETFGSWFDRIGWPIVANIINCTDPGTFNCPYVYSRIVS